MPKELSLWPSGAAERGCPELSCWARAPPFWQSPSWWMVALCTHLHKPDPWMPSETPLTQVGVDLHVGSCLHFLAARVMRVSCSVPSQTASCGAAYLRDGVLVPERGAEGLWWPLVTCALLTSSAGLPLLLTSPHSQDVCFGVWFCSHSSLPWLSPPSPNTVRPAPRGTGHLSLFGTGLSQAAQVPATVRSQSPDSLGTKLGPNTWVQSC